MAEAVVERGRGVGRERNKLRVASHGSERRGRRVGEEGSPVLYCAAPCILN